MVQDMKTSLSTILVLAAVTVAPLRAQPPGNLLREGMTLVYSANGKPGDRWKVEKILHDQEHAGQKGATLIQYAAAEPGVQPEIRWRRLVDSTLHTFDEETGEWSASRPVGPGITWEEKDPTGRVTARYATGAAGTDRIGEREIPIVETTISFLDDQGQVSRRLRERYSLGLETATQGIFEVPDPATPGQWKPTLTFELIQIVD